MASQLIRAWGLPLDGSIVAPLRSNFLQDLLKQAADRRDQDSPNEKIALIVDALDEAGPSPAGQNVLGLPRVLPKGVYLVVSQRPVEVSLATEAPRQIERIDAQSEENRKDIWLFLEAAADWPGIRKACVESDPPVSKESFVATLFDRSQGVWIYLKYVLDEIEAGRRSPLKLDELPQGLWQYYARFWKEWKERHQADWETLHSPAPEHTGRCAGEPDSRGPHQPGRRRHCATSPPPPPQGVQCGMEPLPGNILIGGRASINTFLSLLSRQPAGILRRRDRP